MRSIHHRSSDSRLPAKRIGASGEFGLGKIWEALRFVESLLNAAGEVLLREIEEVVEAARVGEDAVELLLLFDVGEHLRDRRNSKGFFLLTLRNVLMCSPNLSNWLRSKSFLSRK